LYLSFKSTKDDILRVIPKFKSKDKNDKNANAVQENKEMAAIAIESGIDSKIADSMIDTIQEMRAGGDVYLPDFSAETKLNSIANDPLHFQAFSMIVDQIRLKMKRSKMKTQGDDFIKKNKVLIKYWKDYEDDRRKRHQCSLQTNIETANKRKEIIMKFKREKYELITQMKAKLKEAELEKKK
jgi:hypothetical protein